MSYVVEQNDHYTDMFYEIESFDPDSDNRPKILEEETIEDRDIHVAYALGKEDAGFVALKDQERYGELDYLFVTDFFRGVGNGSETLGNKLFNYGAKKLRNDDRPSVVYAEMFKGHIQHMAEKNGLEISGFNVGNNIRDGLTPEMWNLNTNETVLESHLSPRVSTAAESSLTSQRTVEFEEPDSIGEYGLSYEAPEGWNKNAITAEIQEGCKKPDEIITELEGLNEKNPAAWGYAVDFDATDPVAYPLSEGLSQEGWHLINLSPDIREEDISATATMFKPTHATGSYGATPATIRFIEDTGLNYEVEERGQRSDQIKIIPEEQPVNSVNTPETEDLYADVVNAD